MISFFDLLCQSCLRTGIVLDNTCAGKVQTGDGELEERGRIFTTKGTKGHEGKVSTTGGTGFHSETWKHGAEERGGS